MKARITPVRLTGGTPKTRKLPNGELTRASRKEFRNYIYKERKKKNEPNNTDS
jgi:hypothetical protein